MTPHTNSDFRATRCLAAAIVLACALAACSGSDSGSSDAASSSDDDTSVSESGGADDGTDDASSGETSDPGDSSATLTVDDGTVYSFELRTCDTSGNGRLDEFDNSYAVSGTTSDGFELILDRIEFEGDVQVANAILEFDDGSDMVLYSAGQTAGDLTTSGGAVTGQATFTPIGPNRPHGDEFVGTIDVNC